MMLKLILSALKKDKKSLISLILVIICTIIVELIPAKILEHIVNDYLASASKNTKVIVVLSFLYLMSLIFIAMFEFIKKFLLIKMGALVTKEIRLKMAKKLETIEAIYFSYNDPGVISSRFINDVDAISSVFTEGIISILIDLLKIIGIVVEMFIYTYKLGLFTLVIIPIIYVISRVFKRLMYKAQKQNRVVIGKVNNHIVETLKNEVMIKEYSKEDFMNDKALNLLDENYNTLNKVSFCASIYVPIIQLLMGASIAFVVFFSSSKYNLFNISIGALAGAIEYISSLFAPIENMGMEIQNIQKASSGMMRVKEFLSAKEEDKKLDLNINDILKEDNVLEFKDLSFSYKEPVYVLNDINLSIKNNENISFIGRTGVGKTTTFRLVMGLLKPTRGKILLNGIDVRMIPNHLKHQIFGYVNQTFNSIKGSIYENISMKNTTITKDMVKNSLSLVGLMDKINTFEHGIDEEYQTSLFSHGECQLLSIARAIVSNPPILLLDEITASLDTITEKRVIDTINKISESRMILQISHRLASTLISDKVIYIKNGYIKDIYSKEDILNRDKFNENVFNL